MRGLQTDDVGGEQAVHDFVPHVLRQHLPVLRGRPGNVHVVLEHGVGELAPDEARHEVEVVIMREDEGTLATSARLADHLVGKHLVDEPVALVPGAVGAVIEHGRLGQVPEVVLHEPEQGVGDGVVVEVVGKLRRIHPADLEAGAVDRLQQHRLAALAEVQLALEAVPHAGDPDGAGRLGQSGETGHQPAAATNEALPILVVFGQVEGGAIGSHDRMEVLQEAAGVLLDGQHWGQSSLMRAEGRRRLRG